jgi:succinoglycan biosynthesis transport protein ExoP
MVKEDAGLRDYLKIISRRRWVAVAVFVAIFSSVVIYTLTATPVYKSTARVFVDPGTSQNEVSLQQMQNIDISSYIETQLGILKSDSIARAVVQKMRLDKSQPAGSDGILAFLGLKKDVPGPDKMTDAAVKSFDRNLSVQVEGDSSIIRVSYTDTNPLLAAAVANTVVQQFIERNIEMKVEPARAAITWLNSRLGAIKNQMTQSTNQLNDFKRSQDLIQTGDNNSNISVQALSDLNQKLLAAQTVRSEAEVKYSMVQKLANTPDGLMTLPEVINNKVIQNMKDRQSTLAKEIADASKMYGARHPEMIRLNTEMATLNRQMKQEEDFIVLSIKNSYVEALKNEESLKTAFDQQKAKAMDYEKQASVYGLMKQDVEGSRSIYDAVLKKFQESSLAGSMNMSSVQLLDQAVPQASPFRPDKRRNLILGLLAGLLCGIGAAFTFEMLDNTFKTPEDVEEYLRLPMLGIVPRTKNIEALITNPKSSGGEAFRNIRGNLLLSTGDKAPKIMQIVSAGHSEGKTTFALNLAAVMAAAGESILLIDADLRKPKLHKLLKAPNRLGLSSLLSGQSELDGLIIKSSLKGVDLITAGPISPNPAELLGSRTMKDSLPELLRRYDRIIIDCPPLAGLVDAPIISPMADGMILIIRAGKTSSDLVMKSKKNLDAINARVLGVVLNDVRGRSDQYYQYNYGYYFKKQQEKA